MYYVYLLRSINNPLKTYVGYTTDMEQRFSVHNSGGSVHTQADKPWKLVAYVAFDSKKKAMDFEKYIKVGSGYALAKRRFW